MKCEIDAVDEGLKMLKLKIAKVLVEGVQDRRQCGTMCG